MKRQALVEQRQRLLCEHAAGDLQGSSLPPFLAKILMLARLLSKLMREGRDEGREKAILRMRY
jgi:hypothetical protein